MKFGNKPGLCRASFISWRFDRLTLVLPAAILQLIFQISIDREMFVGYIGGISQNTSFFSIESL